MSDVVDEFDPFELSRVIPGNGLVLANDAASIRGHEFGLGARFLADVVRNQRLEPGIEKVQNQPPACNQVPMNRMQARHLIFDRQQMLKRAEWNCGELERLR